MHKKKVTFAEGGGRSQVPLCALFQAQADTLAEPPTFRKLVG